MIDIEDVKRLDVNPGEVLVVKMAGRVSSATMDEARRYLARVFPPSVKVVLIDGRVDGLTVVADPERAAA